MLDLRAVQRAYTAPGQDSRYWRGRAAADIERLDACVASLVARLEAAPATAIKLRASATALKRIGKLHAVEAEIRGQPSAACG